MTISAFGVDHGEIAKADEPYASGGRKTLATVAGPWHGLAAAKPGKKLRTAGRSVGYATGGSLGGSIAGSAIGALATRGRSMGAIRVGQSVGGLGGAYGGAHAAFKTSNRKGYFKPQSKG